MTPYGDSGPVYREGQSMKVGVGAVTCRGRYLSEMTHIELRIFVTNLMTYHCGNEDVRQAWKAKAETMDLSRDIIEI